MFSIFNKYRYNVIMEDVEKVNSKLKELKEQTGDKWVEINGFVSLMSAELTGARSSSFKTDSGYPVKAFINTNTGEVRLFKARMFTDE